MGNDGPNDEWIENPSQATGQLFFLFIAANILSTQHSLPRNRAFKIPV